MWHYTLPLAAAFLVVALTYPPASWRRSTGCG